jgi:hypothetical protein
MILFIIMKEVRVRMGHTHGIKIMIIICLVSNVCTKSSIMSFSTV